MRKIYLKIYILSVALLGSVCPALCYDSGDFPSFYMGLSTGWETQSQKKIFEKFKGILGSVYLGYSFPVSQYTIGSVEADFMYLANVKDQRQMPWVDSLRTRVGYLVGDFFPYLSVGINYGSAFLSGKKKDGTPYTAKGRTTGWNYAAGIECSLHDHLAIQLEFRKSSFGKTILKGSDGIAYDATFSRSDIRGGLVYHF